MRNVTINSGKRVHRVENDDFHTYTICVIGGITEDTTKEVDCKKCLKILNKKAKELK